MGNVKEHNVRINAKTVYKVMKRHSLTLKRNGHKGMKSRKDLTKPKRPNELWEIHMLHLQIVQILTNLFLKMGKG